MVQGSSGASRAPGKQGSGGFSEFVPFCGGEVSDGGAFQKPGFWWKHRPYKSSEAPAAAAGGGSPAPRSSPEPVSDARTAHDGGCFKQGSDVGLRRCPHRIAHHHGQARAPHPSFRNPYPSSRARLSRLRRRSRARLHLAMLCRRFCLWCPDPKSRTARGRQLLRRRCLATRRLITISHSL